MFRMLGNLGLRKISGDVVTLRGLDRGRHKSGAETSEQSRTPMETDGRRMRQLLAGLGEMDMAGTKELHSGQLGKDDTVPVLGPESREM